MLMDLDYVVDLERGESAMANGDVRGADSYLDANIKKPFFSKVCDGLVGVDGLAKGENASSYVENSSEASPENVKLLIEKKMEGEEVVDISEKKIKKEKRKSTSAKKPPKPPRPPQGLSLDAADQKLIKEIAELAMIKRARIERLKALKRMKTAKALSSPGNLIAMLFTILFFLVMIFQGMSSRKSSAVTFLGSPESTSSTEGGLVMAQDHWNPSSVATDISSSVAPELVEQVFGTETEGKARRAAG